MPDCYDSHHAENPDSAGCVAVTYQSASVSVPVTVQPKVSTGHINTFCCGEPKITPSPCKLICNPNSGSCSFILTQTICVEVPVEISAKAFVDYPYVQCGEVSGKLCEECDGKNSHEEGT